MKKNIVYCGLMLLFLSTLLQAAPEKSSVRQRPLRSFKAQRVSKSTLLSTLNDYIVWQDNFEETEQNWWPDANYVMQNDTTTLPGHSNWQFATTPDSNHFWQATGNSPQELDFLISPEFRLPETIPTAKGDMPLKRLKIDYTLKGDVTDNGEDYWAHLLGPSEEHWSFTYQNVGDGISSWFCDFSELSSDKHWRQWLYTPTIELANSTDRFTFMHKLNTETGADYVTLEISEDNFQSYTVLAQWGGDEGVFDWTAEDIDISAWNNKLVKFRWSAKGDYSVTGEGWWIDNIDIGGLFQDDGGEDFTTALWGYGITGSATGTGMSGEHFVMDSPIDNWEQASVTYPIFPLEINGVNSNFGPDDKVRLAINWATDGDAADETPQLAIDNVVVYALARFDVDLAISGANVLSAKQGVNFTPTVYFTNIGLTSIETNFEWTGQLKNESGDLVHSFSGNSVSNLAIDSSLVLDANNPWLPEEAGRYQLTISAPIPGDGDSDNNELNIEVWVPGGPWTAVLWREDFDSNPTAASFEDFGFSIINNGGDAAGNNTNTWELSDDFLYGSGALISSFWGHLNEGENTDDESEKLDEGLVTPAIDISSLSSNNTLHLRSSIYFRSGHPLFSIYGEATSQFSISASLDGSDWVDIFDWIDDDGLPGDGPRLPNHFYPDTTVDFRELLDFDLTPVLQNRQTGQNKLYLKFNLKCENSWFVGMNVDELMVYAGVSAPVITDLSDTPNDEGSQLNLTWRTYQPALTIWDNAGTGWPVTTYEISRQDDSGWTVLNTVPAVANQSVYNDVVSTLLDNLATTVMVTAKTENPLLFQESEPASVASIDNILPEPPQNLAVEAVQNTVTLSWEASPSTDVDQYYILQNNVRIDSTEATTFAEEIGPGEYNYAVVATTGSGQLSESVKESVTVDAGVFLTSVTDIPNDEGLLVTVNWNIFEANMAITDTMNNTYPITAFDIQRNDNSTWITQKTIAVTPDSMQFTAEIPTMADSLETAFKIIAKTADTGKQIESGELSAISADNTDPAAPANLLSTVTGPLVQLSWNPSASADVAGYMVFRDNLPVDTTFAVTFSEKLPSGDYVYFIRTIDDAGRLSVPSNSVTASINIGVKINTVSDVPEDEGLMVTLEWQLSAADLQLPAADGQFWPVLSFDILRQDNNTWTTVATEAVGAGLANYSKPILTLHDNTESFFKVKATTEKADAFIESAPVSGISSDNLLPAAPQNLTAEVTGNQVALNWEPSTSPDVASYVVYRNTAPVDTTSDISWSEKQIPGDYEYQVKTVDDADQYSDGSNIAAVTIEIGLTIDSIVDIEDDEGLQVLVDWTVSAKQIELADVAGKFWPVVTFEIRRLDDTVWNTVGTIPADTSKTNYSLAAATNSDGVETSFQICACTEDPAVYLTSDTVTGTSTDDLVPTPPTNLTTTISGNTVTVKWAKSGSPDVVEYMIYRDATAISSVTELQFSETLLDGHYSYQVSAIDDADQEGDLSGAVVVDLATGVNDQNSTVLDYALYGNYPNPFNPETHIDFSIPESKHVLIQVFNASGQLVASLINAEMPAGKHAVTWQAAENSSGLYFCTMQAGEFTQTLKMILMK